MILAVDVGNSNTTVGLFNGTGELLFRALLETSRSKTRDQCAIELLGVFQLYGADACTVDAQQQGIVYRRKENRMERKSRQQEINEALMAADMASMSLQKAEEQLQKASSWGIWDMLGGGFFSTMFKHNRMDEAQAAMNEARGHLRRLKKELLDVNLTGDLKMDVGSFLTFADYFFDGVIADWMVQSKIGDALNQVREARRQVGCIRKRLQEMRQTLEAEREGR